MDKLELARATIDQTDRKLAALFLRRMEAVREIAAYKEKNRLPVADAARERTVLEENTARFPSEEFRPYYAQFLQSMLELSRQYQAHRRDGERL